MSGKVVHFDDALASVEAAGGRLRSGGRRPRPTPTGDATHVRRVAPESPSADSSAAG